MTLKKRENLVYLIVWVTWFLIPTIKWILENTPGVPGDNWNELSRQLLSIVPLFILFLIHNFLILPILIKRGKTGKYFLFCWLLLTAFSISLFTFHKRIEPLEKESYNNPFPPEVVMILTGMLVVDGNLANALGFKHIQEEQCIKDLEREKLEAQLKYLKYQISPHFFMNTLNIIHALVDIAPEEAKDSIVNLSGLMRYLLYEGDKSTIPLKKEIDLLNQYISLMKLRFDDSVKVSFTYPEVIPKMEVPVLLFISFVENAFKHGISYKEESFINVKMRFDDNRIYFTCENSKHEESIAERGGVGLQNVKKRLELIYGENYHLDINDGAKEYTVQLDIPLEGVKT
jgi:Putative regulator of cell autolysis